MPSPWHQCIQRSPSGAIPHLCLPNWTWLLILPHALPWAIPPAMPPKIPKFPVVSKYKLSWSFSVGSLGTLASSNLTGHCVLSESTSSLLPWGWLGSMHHPSQYRHLVHATVIQTGPSPNRPPSQSHTMRHLAPSAVHLVWQVSQGALLWHVPVALGHTSCVYGFLSL